MLTERRREVARLWRLKNPSKVRAYKAKHREREKARRLEVRYGLSPEDKKALLLSQSGRCAVCRGPFDKICVDHDHKTEKVRGLLCRCCNWMLGNSRDNPTTLRLGAEYLEKHGSS